MGSSYASLLASSFESAFDFGSYTIKDWLQLVLAVFGIIGAVVGAWNWWRFSKWQIVNRLFEYLNTDERNVTEGRRNVLEYLRSGKKARLNSNFEFNDRIQKAIELLDANREIEAEALLNSFALMLKGSAEVGRRHVTVASEQAATIFLFVGLLAKQRADVTAARNALTDALDQCSNDAEIIRSLGELDLDVDLALAQRRFDEALRLAPGDNLLQGELWMLKAKAFEREHVPAPEPQRQALRQSAAFFAAAGADRQAAAAYRQVGALEVGRRFRKKAIESFTNASRCYHRLGDANGLTDMRDRLAALRADLGSLPQIETALPRQIPWHWIRLALELSILAAAAYLFFLTPR